MSICLGEVALPRHMDRRTDRWKDGKGDSYISPKTDGHIYFMNMLQLKKSTNGSTYKSPIA